MLQQNEARNESGTSRPQLRIREKSLDVEQEDLQSEDEKLSYVYQ
jgi:hypothetical protein